MLPIAPKHAVTYCCRDNADTNFLDLYQHYEDECSFVYKIRCTCKCERFIAYRDEHPSIFVECCNCGKKIELYNLDYYPAAVKLKKEFPIKKLDENSVLVYVNYEYDDEFLVEDDVEFDANDITGGRIFIGNDKGLLKILDDETA